MLLAAKMQKEKDAEEESELNKQRLAQQQKHVVIDPKFVKHSEDSLPDVIERERLQNISDRIDECLLRAQRVEQHWNTNFQKILDMLGDGGDEDPKKKSYV